MELKLKRCPFCGKKNAYPDCNPLNSEWAIYCKCGIATKNYTSKKNAVRRWNSRQG
jgi:Lar family restriction alleviation protein